MNFSDLLDDYVVKSVVYITESNFEIHLIWNFDNL